MPRVVGARHAVPLRGRWRASIVATLSAPFILRGRRQPVGNSGGLPGLIEAAPEPALDSSSLQPTTRYARRTGIPGTPRSGLCRELTLAPICTTIPQLNPAGRQGMARHGDSPGGGAPGRAGGRAAGGELTAARRSFAIRRAFPPAHRAHMEEARSSGCAPRITGKIALFPLHAECKEKSNALPATRRV
jgi:hypothetical protein